MSTVNVGSNAATPTANAIAAWKALAPQVTVNSVSVSSGTPVVKFTVKDAAGNGIVGLGNKSQSSTATVAGLTNVAFTLAKLVPGSNSQPGKWVSYVVIKPVTVAQKGGTIAAADSCNKTATAAATWCGTFPSTDTQGALVDNGDGSYQYTFYRDITQVKSIVAGLTDSADGLAKKADLGDLTYDATLTHRLGIQLGGAAPGTGSNTPNAVTIMPGTNMVNTANAVYDFRPDGGSMSSTRNIVAMAACTDCHQGKVLAHGSRKDPNYCVTCHTDQIRYTFSQEASSTNGGFTLTGTTRPTTAVVDGRALGDFPNMVHKIHMGSELVKQGYNFNASAEGKFNEFRYPQDLRNCAKCHTSTSGAANATANGDNWKSVPSPLACGACHDGINFTNGTGTTVAGASTGHGGWALKGAASGDPTLCGTCHDAASITFVHTPVTAPNSSNALLAGGTNTNTNAAWLASNSDNRPAGSIRVTYDIKSVSRNASKQPVMVFRMLQDGVAVPFNDPATKTEIWDNFMGAPSVYFVFAVPQDNITKPADFNASASSYLRSLWNGKATGTAKGTLTYDSASGYYTATLTGVTIPDSAVMLTGGLGYSYNVVNTLPLTQTNLPKYPVAPATATSGLTAGMPNMTGGLIVVSPDVQKVADKYTGRRAIVDDARCNKCHQELGVFTAESFHGGQRNDGTTCSWCHTPNRASSGWSADSTNFVHAIHAAGKRGTAFTWHAASTTEGFWSIGYPGVLKNCEGCHLPGTYDFSATASASAVPNRLYRTVATGIFNNQVGVVTTGGTSAQTALGAFSIAPYVAADNTTNYGAGFSFNAGTGATTAAAATTLVDSPLTTVCFACHDSAAARGHMELNGGSIYAPRAAALAKTEQCMICHGPGTVSSIATMHAK